MQAKTSTFGISRRGLLKGATAFGGAALILPTTMHKASAEPKRGGILRIGQASGSTADGYDPGRWDAQFSQVLHTARCGFMTEIAADGSLVGEVAESWEATPDAATWIFKLRDGITYHSGKAVTGSDVVASINHHRGEDSKSAAKPIVEPITDIKADGNTVVFTLSAGNADFPFLMSDYHLPILPSADGKIDTTTKDGCGGYVIDSYEPGVSAKLSRNPNYWKMDRAWFDGVEMVSIFDTTARLNALITGEVDVIDPVDLNTVTFLERAPGIIILSTTGTLHYSFPMDTRAVPFTDNNVRMALKYALDRQEMVDKILGGYGRIGNDNPIGPSNRYYYAELEQHTYDPDKAKFHLKEAGMDTLNVQLSAADGAFIGAVDAALLYSEKAAAAGINIEVIREPNDGYWETVWTKKSWCASFFGGRPTEDWAFSTGYASGAPWNDTFWGNARFNELLSAARSELDEDKRREMYHEMQSIVSNDGGAVIPMFADYVMGLSDKIAHPEEVAANYTLDGFRAIERWWFA